jgi:preprotein translocase subunit YajC
MKLISQAQAQTEQTPSAPAVPAPPAPPTTTQTGTPQPQGEAAPPSLPDLFAQVVPILVIMAIVWIIVIRPQNRKKAEQEKQLRNVRRGDTLVTASGLIGRVARAVDDNEIELEIAPNVKVRMLRSAIVEVRAKGEPVKDAPAPTKPASSKG